MGGIVHGLGGCHIGVIRVVIVHLDSFASIPTSLFFLRCSNDWCQVGFPLGPVAIDEFGHVLGFFVWVLQVDVGGLLSALEWLPVLRDAPWLLRRFHPGCSQYFQGQIDALALASFKESIVLHVDFQDVLDLKDLAHP